MTRLLIVLLTLISACAVERPGVTGDKYRMPRYTHPVFLDSCGECHETVRPAPASNGNLHGAGDDCGRCHRPSDDRGGWLGLKSFSHQPEPASCYGCHEQDRPAAPHNAVSDCVGCHSYPIWK